MLSKKDIDFLIVDWGTTNFRAFAINHENNVHAQIELPMGLKQVIDGEFAKELEQALEPWISGYQELPIYMAGMVGSLNGWVNVPYVSTPTSVSKLADKTYRFTLPWGATAYIVPGISHNTENDEFDVMRGEEVQVFGLINKVNNSSFSAVFPGTHSKHVIVRGDELVQFDSYMTGELFSVIREHTIIGRDLPQQNLSHSAFVKGVLSGQNGGATSQIFKARTGKLFTQIEESEVDDFLSGILIGSELKELDSESTYLVGNEKLCSRYQLACDTTHKASEFYSGDACFIDGMLLIKQEIENDTAI
ncbi:2-dehydro-3-deoxygalactonokinase [Vibrio sp. F74]|uniref:2-dehydro-3-deoxygalactonokinase n=1 Tax=Vibrio sp. F74 TaxID=700020 RepID=UPI0035F53EF0